MGHIKSEESSMASFLFHIEETISEGDGRQFGRTE